MIKSINSHDEFVAAMNILEKYSQKVTLLGSFDKFTAEEEDEYDTLAYWVADYEDSIPVFPPEPNMPFEKLILIFMMAKRWTVAESAHHLDISVTELTEVLAGKKSVATHLAQKLESVLGLKSDMNLQTA